MGTSCSLSMPFKFKVFTTSPSSIAFGLFLSMPFKFKVFTASL